jgi:hypothetical protein
MADDKVASIADASKPNAGRIYDFLLGGNHNFEVDRVAAQDVIKLNPQIRKSVRAIRWFLGEAVRRLLADGFTQFIDFASGLPTVDHIHQISPAGTRVVYSDLDPVTVAYGQEIIKNNPDTRYICCNIATPERLFEDPDVKSFIDRGRPTVIGFNGIAWFLKDEDIRHSLGIIYEWASPGTRLYISDFASDSSQVTARQQESADHYKNKLSQAAYWRTLDTLVELASPWKVRDPGFKPLEDWLGTNAGAGDNEKKVMGGMTIGGILEK